MKNNKKIIITATIILSVAVIGISIFAYNYNKNNEKLINEIVEYEGRFNEGEKRDDKIAVLKELVSNEAKYSNNAVNYKYEDTLSNFKIWFYEDYSRAITENTLKDVGKEQDKEAINKAKTNLDNAINTIKSDNILSAEEIEEYNRKIFSLVKSYDERLNVIEADEKKAEEERLAKEEADRKAAEEAELAIESEAKRNQQESGSNYGVVNGTGSGSDSSSGDGNDSGGNVDGQSGGRVDISRLEHIWKTDSDGNKIPGSDVWIDRSNGNYYDANGNFLFNGIW